jgi:hypothetical protein
MRNDLFNRKARWVWIWSLLVIVWLSIPPWLSRHGIRSRAVFAQVSNAPGTAPGILAFNVSRTVLSHGRVENARQVTPINPNGLRDVQGFGDPTTGRPGLLTAIANPSPAWQPDSLHITMGWDPNFSKDPLGIGAAATNPITQAALGIPSCFTMIVAEGVAPAFSGGAGSIPSAVRWESTGPLIGQGNLYASVSIPAAGIVAGMELRTEEQLAAYTANSIIWEAPPFGQVVQDTTLMQFGTKNITAHALDLSDPANPVMGPAQSAQVEITRTLHVEIEVLGITENRDGTFRLCAIANMFGNSLEPVTSFWFRWGFDGQTVDLVGDIPGTNMVTIPRIPAAEKDQRAELYVVASCNGGTLTNNPFTADPLDVPPNVFVRKSIGLFTFLSGGCTLEDNESVKITPFGRCPRARVTIVSMQRTGRARAGGENAWIRKTPAAGSVVFKNPEDAAKVTLTENSCTFREVDDSGKTYSNTVTWTTPPEKIIDDGESLAPLIEKCRYQGEVSVTNNPGAYLLADGFSEISPFGNNRRSISDWAPSSNGGGTARIGFDFDSPARYTREAVQRAGPLLAHEVIQRIAFVPSRPVDAPSGSLEIHWRYEYARNETCATVTRDGQELEAQEGMELDEADRVRTESNCNLVVGINGDDQSLLAALGVSESTEFDILLLALGKPNRFEFALKRGQIRSEVIRERGPTQFRISSPAATASVAGTIFTTGYETQERVSRVAVEEGAVLVTPTNPELQPVTVNAGQQVKVTQNNVGPVTAYSVRYFGAGKLLYIGIGAALLVLIVISMLIVSRAKRRSTTGGTMQQGRQPGPPPTLSPPPPAEQAVCDTCGASLKTGKTFCTACGAPRRPASVTGASTSVGSGIESGIEGRTTLVPALCSNPQCRKPLVPGKRFCTACGTPVR